MINISQGVLDILELTEDQVSAMNLREFSEAVFSKGYMIEVSSNSGYPGLTIKTEENIHDRQG